MPPPVPLAPRRRQRRLRRAVRPAGHAAWRPCAAPCREGPGAGPWQACRRRAGPRVARRARRAPGPRGLRVWPAGAAPASVQQRRDRQDVRCIVVDAAARARCGQRGARTHHLAPPATSGSEVRQPSSASRRSKPRLHMQAGGAAARPPQQARAEAVRARAQPWGSTGAGVARLAALVLQLRAQLGAAPVDLQPRRQVRWQVHQRLCALQVNDLMRLCHREEGPGCKCAGPPRVRWRQGNQYRELTS